MDIAEIQSFNLEEIVKFKAEQAFKEIGSAVLVEDVSFYAESLNGFPGPFVKFWEKNVGYDRAVEIAEKLGNDRISIRCGVGYKDEIQFIYVEGEILGKLVQQRGESGFGFDPYFQPDGYEQTFAEMGKEEKNKISHRRKAFDLMRERLQAERIL